MYLRASFFWCLVVSFLIFPLYVLTADAPVAEPICLKFFGKAQENAACGHTRCCHNYEIAIAPHTQTEAMQNDTLAHIQIQHAYFRDRSKLAAENNYVSALLSDGHLEQLLLFAEKKGSLTDQEWDGIRSIVQTGIKRYTQSLEQKKNKHTH